MYIQFTASRFVYRLTALGYEMGEERNIFQEIILDAMIEIVITVLKSEHTQFTLN